MQSIKQLKSRIRSVENTRKVTSAMQMISVAKLNRIDDKLFALRRYFSGIEKLLYDIISGASPDLSPFLQEKKEEKPVLCVIASDNGLCGLYNQSILRTAVDFIRRSGTKGLRLVVFGHKAQSYFKSRDFSVLNSYVGINANYSDSLRDALSAYLNGLFLSGQADKIFIAYTYFENSMVQQPLVEQYLNLRPANSGGREYIFEPQRPAILKELIPLYLKTKIQLILLESFTSEHASRIVAMKTASDNAKDLLEMLVLLRNKVRQASITQEIMEISSSVEALKG